MSLKQIALRIANELQDLGSTSKVDPVELLILAAELRGAASASPDATVYVPSNNTDEERAAMALMQDRAQRAAKRDSTEPKLVFLEGGPADGMCVPMHPDAPVGARTKVEGVVYELATNGKLKFVSV